MTIDERLEKLAERHEALAQAVELMVAENRDRDAKTSKSFGKLADASLKQFELHGKLQKQIAEVTDSVNTLARVAEMHEHRITHLEGGAQA